MITDTFRARVEAQDFAALADAYADDVLFDAHVPDWRLQVHGRGPVLDQLRGWFPNPGRFTAWREERTASGDVLVQLEWREDAPEGQVVVHELQLWRLDDEGRIAEQVVYCAGRWDEQLVARMRREAPLVRP